MFSLESPKRGDSNEYTQFIIFNIKKKITLNYPKSAAVGNIPRDSRMSSKRAISVRATEGLLYFDQCSQGLYTGQPGNLKQSDMSLLFWLVHYCSTTFSKYRTCTCCKVEEFSLPPHPHHTHTHAPFPLRCKCIF